MTSIARWIPAAVVLLTAAAAPDGGNTSHAEGARRHDRPDSLYLALGNRPAFDPVVAIRQGEKHVGSGELIAPRWILTAAHVASTREDGRVTPADPASLRVMIDGRAIGVTRVVLHPSYWADSLRGQGDVLAQKGRDAALLQLESPVTGIAPVALASTPVDPGSIAAMVGHGVAGTAQSVLTGADPAGTKRAGTNIIDQVGGIVGDRVIPPFLLVADFDAPGHPELSQTGAAEPTDLEYLPIGGDSGGGLFVRDGARWTLVGLVATTSIELQADALGIYGSILYATEVSGLLPWLREEGATRG